MKRWILAVLAVMFLGGVAYADLGLSASETGAVKTGLAWGFKDGETYNLSEVEIMSYKAVCLNTGVATDFNGEVLETVSLSYKLGGLERFDIKFPLSDLLNMELGSFYGKDFINTGDDPKGIEDYGVKITILKKVW